MTINQKALDATIKHMVQRFLAWKLPENFNPDGGIIFSHTSGGRKNEPVGTNLFDATQTEAMVRHMLDGIDLADLGGSAEPVARQHRSRSRQWTSEKWGEWSEWRDGRAPKSGQYYQYEERALYLHPAPPSADRAALAAEQIADHIGVTPYSDMRPFVVQAVKYAREQDALSTPAPAPDASDWEDKYADATLPVEMGDLHTATIIDQAALEHALKAAWTSFCDANPDDLTSPEDLPDHALMTCEQFVEYASAALATPAPAPDEDIVTDLRQADKVLEDAGERLVGTKFSGVRDAIRSAVAYCETCNGTGNEARNSICRDCDETVAPAPDARIADQIIGQIEERFPNWRSYRDLIDCIDCTLADLRRRP
jgi:hypothetical protein